MNVCHVITGLNTGGAEVMLQKLVAATAGDGIRHAVVSLIDRGPIGDALVADGVQVDALDMRRGVPDVRAVAALRRLMQRYRPHVVQTWMYHANLLGGFAARLAGIRRVIWSIRAARLEPGSEKSSTIWLARASGRVARHLCRRIVANSEDARQVHEQMGYPSDLFEVIPNGFDLATYRPDPDARDAVRAELGVGRDAVLIGMISRFHPGKEHRTFVDAAGRLAERRPDVHFLLAGDGITANEEPLASWIDRGRLAGRVHLLGRRSDTPRLFASLDLCTLTSAYESFPNVVGEAMASGVPCVVTDVGDAARIVGDTGVVVPLRDAAALSAAWDALLDAGDANRRALGARARERIGERYSLAAVAARYVKLYREVAGG
jgi:glycosyltransferase involved in cell wall biosynthesis